MAAVITGLFSQDLVVKVIIALTSTTTEGGSGTPTGKKIHTFIYQNPLIYAQANCIAISI